MKANNGLDISSAALRSGALMLGFRDIPCFAVLLHIRFCMFTHSSNYT